MDDTGFIPFHRPSIGEEEITEVVHVLRSGWLTRGPCTVRFEDEFRSWVGARHALAVSSGTAGLHLALAALGLGPDDEVITTPLTFASTVHAILHVGARPVLADVGPDGNIAPDSISERFGPRTRAILPVHLGGLSCDMDSIRSVAADRGLFVIEDAAHAVGGSYRGQRVGGCDPEGGPASDAVVFSFYATKNLTTGEGGMVTTSDAALMDRMRRLSKHGMTGDAWDREGHPRSPGYQVLEAGFKYNLSDLQAAIGIHQLRKLEKFVEIRSAYARIYSEALKDSELIERAPEGEGHAWHLYSIRLNLDRLDLGRDEFIEELRLRGVGTSVHFVPISCHAFFSPFLGDERNRCPKAEALAARVVSLPLYPAMTPDQVRRVASSVIELAEEHRRA